MLTCVYPAESFKTKAVTVKLRHGGKSKKKTILLGIKERPGIAKPDISLPVNNNELPVGGGGAVLVLSELESMAARQQREITQQRRLLEQREARLAVLRGAQEPAQQERLARLRHRLDQQQSKLNRLRLLRSQTDQSRANNATLTSDLDCIRALFNEKEKELSLAVAKVEELTRQLEELRGRHNGNATGIGGGSGGGGGQVPSAASAELEKLRRELMYRNKMNEQQNQVVSQQRLVLAQRQAEMVSIDARIAQLQGRLQRKRALNQRLLSQQIANNRQTTATSTITTTTTATTTKMSTGVTESVNKQQEFTNTPKPRPAGNVAAIEPYSHIPNDNDFNLNKNDPKYQTLPYNTKFTVNLKPVEDDVNKNKIQHSQSASQIGQRSTLQQLGHQIVHSQSQSHIQGQSQLLGVNQQTSQQIQQPQLPQHNNSPQNYPPQSGNFLVHTTNNNNNNNNNNNLNNNNNQQISGNNIGTINLAQENQNQLANTRLHSHQQQQSANVQQKQQQLTTTSSHVNQDTRQSITQAHNLRNLQTHQKPVSSVAPSFPVKSPIYQTSSTKIHPVMPQTLSLIGRGHSAAAPSQNYPERPVNVQNSQNSQQQLVPTSMSETTSYPSRHNFQQGQYSQNYKNSSNNFPQASLSNLGNSNYPGYPSSSYNQTPIGNTLQDNTNEKSKFDNKNQEKHDQQQMRYDPAALMKHDNQSTKLFDGNKHEPVTSIQQRFEIPTKFEATQQSHPPTKFDHSQLPGTHQYGKHEQHEARTNTKYDHSSQYKLESHKYDSNNFQQFKQQQQDTGKYDAPAKLDHVSQKYELNQPAKHDHATKLEPPTKLPDKPYDYERTKNENDRKTAVNFVDNKGVEDKMKPALPPKPIKPNPPPRLNSQDKLESPADPIIEGKPIIITRGEKEEDIPPIPTSELPESPNEAPTGNHQIIKARPLTLKKNLLSEQPRLRFAKSNVHVSINRRIEMPPAFLFPETEIPADLMQTEPQQQQQQSTQPQQNISDVTDHSSVKQISLSISDELPSNDILEDSDIVEALNVLNIEDKLKKDTDRKNESDSADIKSNEVIRRKKGNLKSTTGKVNLSRRVSFDPLALLLDASLEGELELVKKTAKEVANPSSANDEGITALHNAICAGHLDIVKFLVEFGCDVNAQDSDGWTPLHCAASCNNLAMVRFLVEHGACIFATTLSDHETAAEKCEEDEEGFDGCSEYLYSVQEKLGIMNNGHVFAVFEYDPQHNDELTLKNGDQLVILRKGDDNEREWWWSKLGHREGYVPRNLLGLYPRVQPSKVD